MRIAKRRTSEHAVPSLPPQLLCSSSCRTANHLHRQMNESANTDASPALAPLLHFGKVVEAVDDYAIFSMTPEGVIKDWNLGAEMIKGYTAEEIIGRHFSVFYSVEDQEAGVPQRELEIAASVGKYLEEGWRYRNDGSPIWVGGTLTAVRSQHGELLGYLKITRDLTDQREKLALREQGRRKDLFLATLAHELRNPIAPMLPALEVIMQSPDRPDLIKNVAATLSRQVEQMVHLIDHLLDTSRITSGKIVLKKSRAILSEVIESAIESTAPLFAEAGHELTVSIPDKPIELEADSYRLCQIITNLLNNAGKFTPTGGRIAIGATVDFPWLTIVVRDNGQGIPHSVQTNIFDLFDQGAHGSHEGLGIGLTLVKYLVELHRGRVGVVSGGDGKGSEFRIALPIVCAPSELVLPPTELPQQAILPRKKVLVADDSRSAADILGMFFDMEGMETAVVYDGLAAVHRAATFKPDLVILDIGMPEMNGFEAAAKIREFLPEAKIVALSGWGSADDQLRSAQAGFDQHIVKPPTPADLRKVVADMGS